MIFVIDVDGVMTNGTVSYPKRERLFNVRDGHGIQLLRERTNINPVVMTGEKDMGIVTRCKKLNIPYYLDVRDKYKLLISALDRD